MSTTWLHTTFGTFQLSATEEGLTETRLTDIEVPRNLPPPQNRHLLAATSQLEAYFKGELQELSLIHI